MRKSEVCVTFENAEPIKAKIKFGKNQFIMELSNIYNRSKGNMQQSKILIIFIGIWAAIWIPLILLFYWPTGLSSYFSSNAISNIIIIISLCVCAPIIPILTALQLKMPEKYKEDPVIIPYYFADTEKEWVRFCLVQLDFSIKPNHLPEEFRYVLNEKDKIRNKVFKALEKARENNADVICFPELSFDKEWLGEITNQYKDIIIIGGSYYDEGYNVCPIIIDGTLIDPPYKKHKPSPFENPKTTGLGMNSGKILYAFQTKCGMFSVLTCIDYSDQSYRVCRFEPEDMRFKSRGVNFIINPCYDYKISRYQHRCNSDCEDYGVNVIQVNKAPDDDEEYGGTCIIGKEHKVILEKLRDEGFKPKDNIEFKLFQLEGEEMIIVDLNIVMEPPVPITNDYAGRIRLSRKNYYKYESESWSPLSG